MLERERLPEYSVDRGAGLIVDLRRAGQKDDAGRARLRDQVEPVLAPDIDVKQNDVNRLRGEMRPCFRERSGLQHTVPLELEVDAAEKAERRLIVDDEDGARPDHDAPEYTRHP